MYICIKDKLLLNVIIVCLLFDLLNCSVMVRIRDIYFLDVRCFCMVDVVVIFFRNSRKFFSEDC